MSKIIQKSYFHAYYWEDSLVCETYCIAFFRNASLFTQHHLDIRQKCLQFLKAITNFEIRTVYWEIVHVYVFVDRYFLNFLKKEHQGTIIMISLVFMLDDEFDIFHNQIHKSVKLGYFVVIFL